MDAFFGPGGYFVAQDPMLTHRPGQLAMADHVNAAIAQGKHLAVEGGTGVGKSFAYLVPALEAVQQRGIKILISTYSIALQQQLVEHDLPRLSHLMGRSINWVLAKGRSNYVSRRRLGNWLSSAPTLFDDEPLAPRLAQWVDSSGEGSRQEWGGEMPYNVWDDIVSDRDNCRGRRCPQFDRCHFHRARKGLHSAEIIIANHALFFSNMALGAEGFLPDVDLIIFDEAHHLEAAASDHLGFRLSEGDLRRLIERLGGRRGGKGLLRRAGSPMPELLDELRHAARTLFRELRTWAGTTDTFRVSSKPPVANLLNGPLAELGERLRETAEEREDDLALDLKSEASKARALQAGLESFMTLSQPGYVHWIEGHRRPALVAAPIDIAPILKNSLFGRDHPVSILTSATLSQGGSFTYLKNRLGFDGATEVVESPFDYEEQMDLIIDARVPDPRDPNWLDELALALKGHLESAPPGGVFLLFTSWHSLNHCVEVLESAIGDLGRPVLVQGREARGRQLLDSFINEGNAVLFGTDSFWTGVDVPGEALSSVMISRLPFQPPDHPLVKARCEVIDSGGGSSFRELVLPETILKLRQGLGRLIRRRSDRGQVVILDPRIVSKGYGKIVRKALPHAGRVLTESEF